MHPIGRATASLEKSPQSTGPALRAGLRRPLPPLHGRDVPEWGRRAPRVMPGPGRVGPRTLHRVELMHAAEIHPGDVIAGKYRVRAILGRAHGLLLEAFHTEFDQRVVIKVLLAGSGDEREIERFRREARTLAKLESEHAARIIDVGTERDGSFYLVRQYLDGIDLGAYVRQNGPLPLIDATLAILMVAEAVAETHSHGIILRELQPSHLFLTQRPGGSPLVRISDFGTAKL